MRDDRGRLIECEPPVKGGEGSEVRRLLGNPLVWGFVVLMAGVLPMAISGVAVPFEYATLLGAAMVFGACVLFVFSTHATGMRDAEEGDCRACGHALAGLEVGEDGCRVCPECGGAWSVNPPVRCLGCGFLVRGVPIEKETEVRCPECGEAWRVGASEDEDG